MTAHHTQSNNLILNDKSIPVVYNEEERLCALYSYGLLDTDDDPFYDDITQLSASSLEKPIAVISLVDRDRIWFKSAYGVDATEIPRDATFCSSAILSEAVYEIEDTCVIKTSSVLVTGALAVRFYAAAPLIDPNGFALGTLCVLSQQPGKLTDQQRQKLLELAQVTMDEIVLRKTRH